MMSDNFYERRNKAEEERREHTNDFVLKGVDHGATLVRILEAIRSKPQLPPPPYLTTVMPYDPRVFHKGVRRAWKAYHFGIVYGSGPGNHTPPPLREWWESLSPDAQQAVLELWADPSDSGYAS